MTKDDEIAELKVKRQMLYDELEAFISEHAPEAKKQAVAECIKALSAELEKLGHDDGS
jgi:shikimate kinase